MAKRFFTRQFDPSMRGYLENTDFINKMNRQAGKGLGSIGGTLMDLYKQQQTQKVLEDMKKAQEEYAADTFKFDEDEYRKQLEEQRRLQEPDYDLIEKQSMADEATFEGIRKPISEEEWSKKQDQTYMEQRDMDPDLVRLDMENRNALGLPLEQSVEPEEPQLYVDETMGQQSMEITPEEIAAERERRYNALFASPEERAEYERLRKIMPYDMSETEKFRRTGMLLLPHNTKMADYFINRADTLEAEERKRAAERSDLELQLGVKERLAADKAKVTQMIRAEQAWDGTSSRTNQLTQQYNQLVAVNRLDDAAVVKKDLDKWKEISKQQYKKLTKMDPEKYPDFDKIKVPDEDVIVPSSGNTTIDAELQTIATKALNPDNTIDFTEIDKVTNPTHRNIVINAALQKQKIRNDEVLNKQAIEQAKTETALKKESLAKEKAGTISEQQGKAYLDRLKRIGPQLKPVDPADMAAMAGTGIKIVDLFAKVKASPAKTAALNYIMTILRKESGAAISGNEITQAMQAYIPATTDTPEQDKLKADVRAGHLKEFEGYAGRLNKTKYITTKNDGKDYYKVKGTFKWILGKPPKE